VLFHDVLYCIFHLVHPFRVAYLDALCFSGLHSRLCPAAEPIAISVKYMFILKTSTNWLLNTPNDGNTR